MSTGPSAPTLALDQVLVVMVDKRSFDNRRRRLYVHRVKQCVFVDEEARSSP